jgi:hypothetical protein
MLLSHKHLPAVGCTFPPQAELVEEGLVRSQWFVTGEVDPRLFSDSFAFKDESVATTGIKAYATGALTGTAAAACVCLARQCLDNLLSISADTHDETATAAAAAQLAPCW